MRAACESALLTSPQAAADRCGISCLPACLVGIHTAQRCATRGLLTSDWTEVSLADLVVRQGLEAGEQD